MLTLNVKPKQMLKQKQMQKQKLLLQKSRARSCSEKS
jgi:hypothetical protein